MTFRFFTISLLALCTGMHIALAAGFTNGVDIVASVSFAITDELENPNSAVRSCDALFSDKELNAEYGLFCVLRNTGTNDVVAAWRSLPTKKYPKPSLFMYELLDSSGKRVWAETGSSMPKKLPFSPSGFRSLGPRPGEFETIPFGLVTNLFRIPSPGTFTLSVQLRYWVLTNNHMTSLLTEPVRLPLIVRGPTHQIGLKHGLIPQPAAAPLDP